MRTASESQRFLVLGHVFAADDDALQQVLAQVYDSAQRPRCLCRDGGVEMYVARHGRFVIKRMPDTGSQHHPGCPSYAPEAAQSGLGELVGEAVLEMQPGQVELRVDFPWAHSLVATQGRARIERESPAEVQAQRRRMSLRAVTHFLFERAGLNRWVPAMAGKRRQGVIQKYLMEAAGDVSVKGERLARRLYVPEAFNEATYAQTAQRRREKLALLHPTQDRMPLALLVGEFKSVDAGGANARVWIKHMPDVPLWVDRHVWTRIERSYAALFEARSADVGARPRLLLSALIRARREHTYEIDAASLMLTSEQWIPVEGVHELPLLRALVEQGRRFVKPLRYDAAHAGGFPNALLLDVGGKPVPLHVVSPFLSHAERGAKSRALAAQADESVWVWESDRPLPPFPPAEARGTGSDAS
ncbi:DUF1173 family protein [Xanthomonas hortorum]|uniref:DUF1173 domain-containing protein n=1 Tax=Xanthomonas hortorum pv. hederae TaxID=453603 RepID=A0A9X4BVB6_9XANT|nr:DUF1173 family protein [Xanthomonas hortorum]MCE4369709.1 DUF1173 domain-containing protein [Xanthomonas hortorum pv. hederae]MDC8640222.1 DUF1173 domain-containing protein [Xanthomonas hortorum pv. hederae]PPU86247.1 hypothetical protein XhhCFBP4925_00510 [Xanthomonas hortorum pv. hederae]PUF01374.1 DUF1173 domain-containing protein [Xanthomonas hortorum pv. hederae]